MLELLVLRLISEVLALDEQVVLVLNRFRLDSLRLVNIRLPLGTVVRFQDLPRLRTVLLAVVVATLFPFHWGWLLQRLKFELLNS